jgi:hypothetical protein
MENKLVIVAKDLEMGRIGWVCLQTDGTKELFVVLE